MWGGNFIQKNIKKYFIKISKEQRQTGLYKANPSHFTEVDKRAVDESTVYDWIVDIDLMTHIINKGWSVYLSPRFLRESGAVFEESANN